jgi:predicted HTH transcriptional regulator
MLSNQDFDHPKFPHSENDVIELKESINFNHLSKYRETLCAFLNTSGGHLIFGIKDNLDVVGIRIHDKDLDEFICITDQIISDGLIVCCYIDNQDNFVKISCDALKTKIIVNSKNKRFFVITTNPSPNTEYQLKCGSIFRRLNASNYHVKNEKMYKQSELNGVVKKMEYKLRTLHNQNTTSMKKTLQDKDDEIEKLKTELYNYEQYLVNPLMNKLNDNLSKDDCHILDTICEYLYDFFTY